MELLRIGNCKEEIGKITKGSIVVKLNNELKIPVFIVSGKEEGPTAFISAGMHGDELNGIQVVKILRDMINPDSLSGRIIFIPAINILGFKECSRLFPLDNKDLNRQFGKKNVNFPSEKVAKAIFDEVVKKCDFGIDCHDSNAENVLLTHPRILSNNEAPEVTALSRIFGTDLIMERNGKKGMLAIEAYRKLKVPVLTIEIGGGVKIWDEFVEEGVKGIMNILVYKKMINGIIDVPIRQFILDYRHGYAAPFSGLVDVKVNLGDAVDEGEVIATLYDPEKDFVKEIKAEHPGVVFSVRLKSKINKGETMFSVLHFKHGKNKAYALNAEMILNKEIIHGVILRPTKVLDTFLSIFDSSYSLIYNVIGDRLEKIKKYFKK